jgi:putative N6-adenine-specific DNA methylase
MSSKTAMSSSSSTVNIFVTCGQGLEELLQQELLTLGIESRVSKGGVFLPAHFPHVYAINYLSRLAIRVLWPIKQFRCTNKDDLYKETFSIDWTPYLTLEKTFAIDFNVTHNAFSNTLYAAQVMKDALCDSLKEKWGARPNVNVKTPDVQLHLLLHGSSGLISFDTSGMPLFKRGYRQETVVAPLQECLAAAILMTAGYKRDDIICDPFCGSGTFLVEAAMMATNTPSGFFRSTYGFFNHPLYVSADWQAFKTATDQKITPLKRGHLLGADKDSDSIDLLRRTIEKTRFPIHVEMNSALRYQPPVPPTLIVANPPFGIRLKNPGPAYEELGQFISRYPTARKAILSPTPDLIQKTRQPLKPSAHFVSGGLPITLYVS